MNTKIIKLDINNKMYETITAKQGDTESRFLLFHLFDASLPFDLTEKSVRVYGIKPDGTKIFNDLVINDVKKGYCTLKLTNQMLAIAGLVKLELVIYSGNKKLSSIPFMLNVISSLNSDDAVVSTNEFTSLMNGLAALSEYDIYKSNAKQVPGIKEEVSNLSSQLDTNTKLIGMQDLLPEMNWRGIIKTLCEHNFNVKDFGAKGDGITDDTNAIKRAIQSSQNLYFPEGTYIISEKIALNKSTYMYGSTCMQTWGSPAKTVLKGIHDDFIFECQWGNANNFEKLCFNGKGIYYPCSSQIIGCEFTGTLGIEHSRVTVIEKCSFHNCSEAGIKKLVDSRVTNNFFYSNEKGIYMYDSNDNIIEHNKIEWNNVGIELDTNVYNLIQGNIFDRNTTYGIESKNGSQLSIKNNQFERNLSNHIKLNSNLFDIVGNSFYAKNSEDNGSGETLPLKAIELSSASKGLITSNTIQGQKMFSEQYGYFDKLTIYNNIINGVSDLPTWINIGNITVNANSEGTLRYQWSSLDFLNANGYDVIPLSIRCTNGSEVYYNNISFYMHANNGLYATVKNNSDESKEFTVYVKFEHKQWTKR